MKDFFGGLGEKLAQLRDEFKANQRDWAQGDPLEISLFANLADADVLLFGWGESYVKELSATARTSAVEHVAAINEELEDAIAGREIDTNRLQNAVAGNERLLDSVFQRTSLLLASETSESQLDSGKLLNPRVGGCLDVLRSVLSEQLSACRHAHVARLKLTSFNDDVDQHLQFFFDLFLSSRFDWVPCRWLESRCTIEQMLVTTEKYNGCTLIKDAELLKYSLHLRLGERPMGSMLRSSGSFLSSPTFPTVSLGHLIDGRQFNTTLDIENRKNRYFLPNERAILCFILAKSLVHLSRGTWNRTTWNVDDIFFLEDPGTQTLLDKHKPYLSWKIESSSSANESVKSSKAAPYNSQLVDFARLLIEVHTGERVKFNGPPEELQPVLYDLIDDPRRFRSPHKDPFCVAVNACLGPEGQVAAKDESNPGRLQVFIYERVLLNLEAYYQGYGEPRPERTSAPTEFQPVHRRPTIPPVSDYDGEEYDEPKNQMAAKDAATFIRLMNDFTQKHIVSLSKQQCLHDLKPHLRERIKICVIDSGLKRPEHDTRILGFRNAGRILGGRNFLPGCDPAEYYDDHGHGTHVSCLIMDMAPQADIYVAKVSNEWSIEGNKLHCIADAIKWAVQVWDVDIITMSLVMQTKDLAIESALNQAINPASDALRRRIVFAAAGNNGGNDTMPWPASMPGIIPIHATDGLGAASNINPTAVPSLDSFEPPDNFATLGRDIKSRWKPSGARPKNVYLSGTSFATPIAAAIAANVLEYARWSLNLSQDQRKRVNSGGFMKKVFRKMGSKKGDYHYVQPWTLWDRGWDNGSGRCKDVKQVLKDVCATY